MSPPFYNFGPCFSSPSYDQRKRLKLTSTAFRIGNLDVVDFVEAAMRVNNDPTRMPAVHGSVSCQGDFNPLVLWSVDFPLSGALPSVRMGTTAWAMVGVSIAASTFL